jgi:hypothetical protein
VLFVNFGDESSYSDERSNNEKNPNPPGIRTPPLRFDHWNYQAVINASRKAVGKPPFKFSQSHLFKFHNDSTQ